MQNNRKIIYGIIIGSLILFLILAGIIFSMRKDILEVIFLDVKQGDAILISQGKNQILIDGGKDGRLLLEKLGKYIPFWDRNIEMIVATHPDQDHIGGLIDILNSYHVDLILKTNAKSESETYKKFEEEIIKEKSQKIEAKKDVTIKLSYNTTADVLFPINSLADAIDGVSNENSVVIKLTYGTNKFLFTGDLPNMQETKIINSGKDLTAQVLKVSHHGSKYATENDFLGIVKPADAIISVGKNNQYGHPNQEVLDRLLQHKIKIFRTDEMGDIVYKCISAEFRCVKVAN